MSFNAMPQQTNSFDMDICALLQTMSLSGRREEANSSDSRSPPETAHIELSMMDDLNYQSDEGSECSVPGTSVGFTGVPPNTDHYGCAYLQTIRSQIENYPTTGGEYVEAIFTHREVFSARPAGHRDCARGFSDIATVLEKRAWRADREADSEAVSAFRYEAWVIANALPVIPEPIQESYSYRGSSSVCSMPPAY